MKTSNLLNTKVLPWVGVGVSVVVLGLGCLILGRDISNPFDLLMTLPIMVTVDLALWEAFRRWFWRWRFFRPWLVRVPNLNGEWHGTIRPNEDDPATEGATAIQATLAIRQTLTGITCIVRTAEMKSASFVAGFRIDPDQQLSELSYSYQSVPRSSVRQRSAPHYGTALLEFHNECPARLEGEYWTSRNTSGEITFRFSPQDTEATLPVAEVSHPVGASTD